MEELIIKKCAEIEQKNTSFCKDKTASVTVPLCMKSTTTEEKYDEKERLNTARKKLQALDSSLFSSRKPKAPEFNSLFNEKEEISNAENNSQINGKILTFISSDDGTASFKPDRKTNSEKEPTNLVEKASKSNEVESFTGSDVESILLIDSDSDVEKSLKNHNLQKISSSAMVNKDIEPKNTSVKNIKTSKDTEQIPFLEVNYEIEILQALKEHISEKNTVASDEFVPLLFQPKSWKVKDMREIIKPGELENKENSLTICPHEDINQTWKNCLEIVEKLLASKPDQNQSNDQCFRQNGFASILSVGPSAFTEANKGFSSCHSDYNNSRWIPNKDNQTSEEISGIFEDNNKYQISRPPCSPKYSTVPVNPYTESDYRFASSHLLSRDDLCMQTIGTPLPQFSPSEDVPVTRLEVPLKPSHPKTNPIPFKHSRIYNNDANYRGYEAVNEVSLQTRSTISRAYHTNDQYRKQYFKEIAPNREYRGRMGFYEERTQWRGSPRGYGNKRDLIDCQSAMVSCKNEQQSLPRPFEDRRRQAASMDRSFVRYSNICDVKPSSSSPLPACKTMKSVRAENFDKDRKSESDFSDHYKQSNEQNSSTENLKDKKYNLSLSKIIQPKKTHKILTKHIETNKQKNIDPKYITIKNITAKPSNFHESLEKPKSNKRSSESMFKKEIKGVKTKYSFKMKTVRGKLKSSKFKKTTKVTKKDKGDFVKRKEIKTTALNMFYSSGSSKNKENSSKSKKFRSSEKVYNCYSDFNSEKTQGDMSHFSSLSTELPEKDIVVRAKKAKKAIVYSDSESETSLATKLNDKSFKKGRFAKIKRANRMVVYSDSDSETSQATKLNNKSFKKGSFAKIKRANKIVYSDSDSEPKHTTKKGPEIGNSVNSKKYSSERCKDMLFNGGSGVIVDLKKANVKTKSNRNVKPHTTGTKMYKLGHDVIAKKNKFEDFKSAANDSNDLVVKNALEENALNDNTETKNVKQNNICNDMKDVSDEVPQEKNRDNAPDLKKQTITKQQLDTAYTSEHKRSQSSHIHKINKTAIPKEKHTISIDNGIGSTFMQCESHSDATSIRRKDEKTRKVVDFPAQGNNVPEMSIIECLNLAQDLLKDVPKTIFKLFIYDLCIIRAKQEISEIINKLNSITSNVELVPAGDSSSDLDKDVTQSKINSKNELKIKIVYLPETGFKVKKQGGRPKKHKNLTEVIAKTAVETKSIDKVVENEIFTTPDELSLEPTDILLESQESDFQDKACHTRILDIEKKNTIDQDQPTSDKIDCSHFKVANVDASEKKYVCFINGKPDNFMTSSPVALLRHVEIEHANEAVWDGYCAVCEKTVIPQGQHNYVECLLHMLDNHDINEFPVLDQIEAISHEGNLNVLLDTELKIQESKNSNENHVWNSAMRETLCTNSNEITHFKINCVDTEAETYVCCVGGKNNHFETTRKISMIKHARTMHPQVWDGYCSICKEFVMLKGQHSFEHCFKHMLDSHLDNFPALDQTEIKKEVSHPERASLEPDGLNEPKEYELIKNIFKIAKDHSFDTFRKDNCSNVKSQQLNILVTSGVETECSISEEIVSKGTLESLSKGADNTIDKEKMISVSSVEASHSKKEIRKPGRPLKCEELQATVMKAKHCSVLDSMLTEEKLVQVYKCTGRFCAYTTSLPEKALLHIMTHQKASEKDESVSFCAYCDFKGDPTDVVTHVFETHGHCNYVCGQCFYRATASQLVLAHMYRVHGSSNKILQVATPACDIAKEPLPLENAIKSYICGNKNTCSPECQHPYFTQGSYMDHLRNHDPPYLCTICAHSSKEPTELLLHLSDHGLKQYHCPWCSDGADSEADFLAHFSACHPTKKPQAYTRNVTNIHEGKIQTMVLPLLEINKPRVATKIVTLSSNKRNPDKENDCAVREVYKALNLEQLVTGVSQIHQHLSSNSIAVSETRCSSKILNLPFSYKLATANDASLIEKHTQDTASDNIGSRNILKRKLAEQETFENITKNVRYDRQMPSLDVYYAQEARNSTEEMHRIEEESLYPKYVPVRELYRCGAKGCFYMSVDEVMLKCHWETLHLNNCTDFKCPHCQYFVTGTRMTWANVVEHVRMHGNRLYVCTFCYAYHYQYEVLEDHVSNSHEGVAQVTTIRDQIGTPNGDVTISITSTVPWKCTRCKYRTNKKTRIARHCKNTHSSFLQFKCTECEYESRSKLVVKKHKYKTHGLKNDYVIENYYYDDGPAQDETVDKQKKENVEQKKEKAQINQPLLQPGMIIKMRDSKEINQDNQVSHSIASIMTPSVGMSRRAPEVDNRLQGIQEPMKSKSELNNASLFSNYNLGFSVQATTHQVLEYSQGYYLNNEKRVPVSIPANDNRRNSLVSSDGGYGYIQQSNIYNANYVVDYVWKCPYPNCPFSTIHETESYDHLLRHRYRLI